MYTKSITGARSKASTNAVDQKNHVVLYPFGFSCQMFQTFGFNNYNLNYNNTSIQLINELINLIKLNIKVWAIYC